MTDPDQNPQTAANAIVHRLREAGFSAYWAGGAVRDRLLGETPSDVDVATSATPDQVVDLFPRSVLTGKSFGVVRAPSEGLWIEVATFRRDGIYRDGRRPEEVEFATDPETDARRRDFTVNALFYDPLENRVLDSVGGQEDLEKKVIRAVGDPSERFAEDRLRLLRAIRFAARLDFSIEPETWKALCAEAPGIVEISAERIRDEILRILVQPRAGMAFRLTRESGLLAAILPEVDRLAGVEQPEQFHPEGDVFVHTMMLLDRLYDRPDQTPSEELALAALFHDIGKPDTFQRLDRIRFNGHDRLGAKMFERVAKRLRLPNAQTERVETLIAKHMCFRNVPNMREARRKRLLRSDFFTELLELHRLDCVASHGELDLYEMCREELEELGEEEETLHPPRLLTGGDLIELGLTPGPEFATILSEIEDLQLERRISSKEEAIAHVREKRIAR